MGTETADARSLRATATYEAERRIAWLRLVIMVSGTILFPFVSGRPGTIPWLAWSLLASGWLYTVAVLVTEPYRRYEVFRSAKVTTIADAVMTLLWVLATGGLDSPWSIALYAMIITLSFRNGPQEIALGATLSACGYVAVGALLGQLRGRGVDVAVHVLYFFFTATAGALIAHERHRQLASRVRLLDMAQEVAQVGSWEWSIADNELSWSESLHRMFGLGPDVTPSFEAYVGAIAPEDRERVTGIIGKAREDLQPFRFDHRIVKPDGTLRWLHCRGRVVVGSDGRATEMFGSAQDVTERREMQAQLVLSSKLASLGTLASGIAHEINNPLAYVSNNLAILERRLEGDAEMRSAIQAARHGSARVRDIVRGLRTFSRAEDDVRSPVDVAALADLAIAMVAHELDGRAEVVRRYEGALTVDANESRLSQVLVNLLVNAAQAIEPGRAAENRVEIRVASAPEGRVAIEVADTGHGISDEHLPRIFDPFFTTKPTGVGNGLGLAICHGIVTDLGGTIEVVTGTAGTTFRVLLPASSAETRPAAPAEARSCAPARRMRVLVVDDEERYASSLKMLLEPERVVTMCLRARDAIDLLASGETFDAVLCDLMMPGMTGIELHAELTKGGVAPHRVVFLTGGPTSDEARAFLERPDVQHLVKPVELPDLERLLDDIARGGTGSRSAAAE